MSKFAGCEDVDVHVILAGCEDVLRALDGPRKGGVVILFVIQEPKGPLCV